jgi:hypothetical protein
LLYWYKCANTDARGDDATDAEGSGMQDAGSGGVSGGVSHSVGGCADAEGSWMRDEGSGSAANLIATSWLQPAPAKQAASTGWPQSSCGSFRNASRLNAEASAKQAASTGDGGGADKSLTTGDEGGADSCRSLQRCGCQGSCCDCLVDEVCVCVCVKEAIALQLHRASLKEAICRLHR